MSPSFDQFRVVRMSGLSRLFWVSVVLERGGLLFKVNQPGLLCGQFVAFVVADVGDTESGFAHRTLVLKPFLAGG